LDLGFEEIIQPGNIVVIEWAEKIKDILPENTLWLKFKYLDKDKREIEVS
jgi:tRNA A37 threonylcarbamoyladenosine biosynthesis protein TsaE